MLHDYVAGKSVLLRCLKSVSREMSPYYYYNAVPVLGSFYRKAAYNTGCVPADVNLCETWIRVYIIKSAFLRSKNPALRNYVHWCI
jgi:hypothetical protein